MKIGIDARFLTHPQVGGFKTYSENLITALAEIDHDNDYILYFDRVPAGQTNIPTQSNFATRVVPGTLPVLGMVWREQARLTHQIALDGLDLFHAPSLTAPLFLSCSLVVTIHDMIWRFPERFTKQQPWSVQRKLMEWYYRIIPRWAASQATTILTVSNSAKESIVEHLKLPTDRIVVTHEAASPLYRQVDERAQLAAVCDKHNLGSNFILAIGSADPRKNMTTLVQAYAQLPTPLRQQFPLVIVWTHAFLTTELREQVTRLGLTNHIRFLERVSNTDLIVLYNLASLFVFPSRYEGFGLPPLEAMACGTPVIAADNSSIPEVVGDAALLFDAEDTAGMTVQMTRVLTDPVLKAQLIQNGFSRSASFSWRNCAQQTLAAYRCAFQQSQARSPTTTPDMKAIPRVVGSVKE